MKFKSTLKKYILLSFPLGGRNQNFRQYLLLYFKHSEALDIVPKVNIPVKMYIHVVFLTFEQVKFNYKNENNFNISIWSDNHSLHNKILKCSVDINTSFPISTLIKSQDICLLLLLLISHKKKISHLLNS